MLCGSAEGRNPHSPDYLLVIRSYFEEAGLKFNEDGFSLQRNQLLFR